MAVRGAFSVCEDRTELKRRKLDRIAEEVRNLRASPLYGYREENGYAPVMGEGDPEADIMLVGEAPGREEAESGRPFVGPAGDLLNDLLESADICREDVYITNLVKDRPPGNRTPRVEEIELYGPILLNEIACVRPEVVAPLGRVAARYLLEQYDLPEQEQKMAEIHGSVLEGKTPFGEVVIVPVYHPAAALYDRELLDVLREDLRVVKRQASTNAQDQTA